jgi:hypothetical protein
VVAKRSQQPSFPLEVGVVWALVLAVAVAITITYSRTPASELYNVSNSGIAGGLSRVLVFLNWPVALLAIPVLLLLADRLGRKGSWIAAIIGIVFCAAVFWPGIVKQSNLDAKWANAVPAIGVAIAIGLTVVSLFALSASARPAWMPGDVMRIVLAIAAAAVAVPWIAADLGLYLDGVPVLRTIYLTGVLRHDPGATDLHPAVHHGHHHGMDGFILVFAALLLSRCLGGLRRPLALGLAAYLALMFTYGVGNLANDAWLEQVVKRGWTNWQIPSVTTPSLSLAWAVVVASAVVLFLASRGTIDRSPRSDTTKGPTT